jgi:hypothetical protein
MLVNPPLMHTKQFFNASIVDELAHLMEKPHHTSLTQGWTFTLEGEVDSGAIREALDAHVCFGDVVTYIAKCKIREIL